MEQDRLYQALKNAHEAGDTESAKKLAEYIRSLEEVAPAAKQPFVPATKPTPQEIERQTGAALMAPPAPKKPTVAEQTSVDMTDPEAALFQSGVEQQKIEAQRKAEEPPKLSMEQVANDDALFNRVKAYMEVSGQDKYKEGDDRVEYVNKFMSNRNFRDWGATFGGAPELARLTTGNEATRKAVAEGRQLYDRMEDRGGVTPYVDAAKGLVSDIPAAAISAGVGRIAGGATMAAASKLATQQALAKAGRAGIAVGEAGLGAAIDIQDQRLKQRTEKQFLTPKELEKFDEDLDLKRTALVAVFSGALGYVGSKGVTDPSKAVQEGKALEEALKDKNLLPATPTSPPTPVENALLDPINENMSAVVDQWVQITGKQVLDDIDPVGAITDAKVRNDMSKAAIRLATRVIQEDPNFALRPNEQISTAISGVLRRLDQVDSPVLERAIKDTGISMEEFSAAFKVTKSEMGRGLQQLSAASRLFRKVREIEPEFDKKIREMYNIEEEEIATGWMSAMKRAEVQAAREWKAIITSGVDTTARNVLSVATVLPLKAGVKFMEGTYFALGSALSKSSSGNRVEVFNQAMGDTIRDSINTAFYLIKHNLAKDVSDVLLQDNPLLRNQIASALQETGTTNISAFSKWANSFNIAVDSFIRRAVFTGSVETQLRRQGIDLYKDVLANNKPVSVDILKQATKEALQTTFSYLPPKAGDKTATSAIERGAGIGAAHVIDLIDKTPFINFLIPFPRYMANAAAYVYRYSPVGSIGAYQDFKTAKKMLEEGASPEKVEHVVRKAREKSIEAVIGSASLAGAYFYREENPDVPWYEVKTNEGTTVDVRPMGPPAVYFAFADVLARINQGTLKTGDAKAAIESLLGLKFKAGTQDTFIDRAIRVFDNEKAARDFAIEAGVFTGDIAGGFTQPFVVKQFVDLFNAIRNDGTKARDPNVIEDKSDVGASVKEATSFLPESVSDFMGGAAEGAAIAGDAATQRVMNRLPVLKEQLPEAVVRINPEEIAREGEYFARLLGFRQLSQRSPEETEIVRLNLDPYRLYGSSSGDKTYDRAYIENANKLVLPVIRTLINNKQYQSLDDQTKNSRLENAVKEAASKARTQTDKEFKANDLKRVYQMRFNKLPKKTRDGIKKLYAEDNEGRDIEETQDYFAINKYEAIWNTLTRPAPAPPVGKYAVGGIVSKLFGKAATKKLGSDAAEQTDVLLSKPATKAVETPVTLPKEEPLPTPSQPVSEPPMGILGGYKPFADEDYAKGLQIMKETYGEPAVKQWSFTDPSSFADTMHGIVKNQKKMKWNEGPEMPSKVVSGDKNVDKIDDVVEVEYDADGNPLNDEVYSGLMRKQPSIQDDIDAMFSMKAKKGSLKSIRLVDERDNILSQIKTVRKETFPKLQKDKRAGNIDEDVLGVAQGDFRFTHGVEVDPTNKKSMDTFFKLAQQKQKQYDALKQKYKDVPPIKLYHGTMRKDVIEPIKKSGFAEPSKDVRKHAELDVGAPSFTRDVNLNFRDDRFGGDELENYVAYEMPYADYVFKRVNMAESAYKNKDLNVIARTVSGAPNTVRPLGLPKGGFYETEDAIIEAEKLSRTKAFKRDVVSDLAQKNERYREFDRVRRELSTKIRSDMEKIGEEPTKAQAYKAYRDIKAYMNNMMNLAENTSTKTGMGQQYAERISTLPFNEDYLLKLAKKLDDEKAYNLAQLRLLRKDLRKAGMMPTKQEEEAVNRVKELTTKFNKGGLVT